MTSEDPNTLKERRRFPRVMAPIFCRPAGFLQPRKKIGNISLGGLRIYSDQLYKLKDRLEIEIFLPDQKSIIEVVQVVWIKALPPDGEALYDLGVEFIRLAPENVLRLQAVLEAFPVQP
jgi:hypothetical protein